MEDGDGEGEVMDTTSTSADEQCKEPDYEESNSKVLNSNSCAEQNDECRLENCSLSKVEETGSETLSPGSKINYKGFKKRILAQAQESQPIISRNETQEKQLQTKNFNLRSGKDKKSDTKRGKITEYAQYLGLQPAAKYKCLKCHSGATFCTMSMLKQHQKTCTTSSMTPMQGVLGSPESSSMPISPNFRITRKVYLCSACGTYFENWNLFLHMREVHKRHICLFCLGMFGQAERLSYHLSSKHSVPETEFQSVEDFYNSFKGSCYLICCNCEKVFSETDDFYNHFCSMPQKQSTSSVCSVCRQTDSHASSCTLAVENRLGTDNTTPQSSNSNTSIRAHALPNVGSGKGTSKRIIRNNRLKMTDSLKTTGSSQQKSIKAQKIEERIQPDEEKNQDIIETNQRISESSDTELKIDTSIDTVAETIMEVSRYVEGDMNAIAGVSDTHKKETLGSELRRDAVKQNYDSVTETIMEVSRFHEDSLQALGDDCWQEIKGVNRMRESQEIMDIVDRRDSGSLSVNVELDDRLNVASLPEDDSDHEKKRKGETPPPQDSGTLHRLQTLGSSVMSSTAPSLFSPQHEVQTLDVNLKENQPEEFSEKVECEEPVEEEAEEEEEEEEDEEEDEFEESTEKEELGEPSESQTSVSFNAVAATDRSLVIKICTKRVSKISVATTNTTIDNDENNHNTSRESEENNNGEGPTSEEKTSNLSEREREGLNDYQVNPEESDSDSDKLAVVVGAAEESEEQAEEVGKEGNTGNDKFGDGKQEQPDVGTDGIILVGEEAPSIDLNVEGTMESLEIETLLRYCIAAASPTCVYCNHARQIAVNGKQLGLHMLAEHRFIPQHPAIIIHREQFISRIKKALPEVETYFFNSDSYNTTEGTYNVPKSRIYECFHCRFHSAVHKELYLHNRKMHQKTILICIMCKSTFYSYSELLCHLCPGVYSPNINVKYRCCLCPSNNLPSAFRLMVHLRKRHHACDVCLEATGNQQRLSNHVWKHKLHHLCYRCGIAYRNKPDITKHLFWKHGTESVLCKKCLQKKWPHVYHFCIPPTAFVCEECGSSFSRAVALKVHKRLHSGDKPYSCETCSTQFISKKLMLRHHDIHKEQIEVHVDVEDKDNHQAVNDEEGCGKDSVTINEDITHSSDGAKDGKESVKKVVDVYDLPPLNLSSDSDSESDTEKVGPSKETNKATSEDKIEERHESEDGKFVESHYLSSSEPNGTPIEIDPSEDEKKEVVQIIDGIWDNFKSYTASLEMKESSNKTSKDGATDIEILRSIILADHDYCVVYSEKVETDSPGGNEGMTKAEDSGRVGGEDDYTSKALKSPEGQAGDVKGKGCENESGKKKPKTPRKKKQSGSTSSSDSSSDSDSSNCSCGTNCSCSSSSSGSSSSSSSSSDSDSSASEGSPRKQTNRKDRKKVKDLTKKSKSSSVETEAKAAEVATAAAAAASPVQTENGMSLVEICSPPDPPPEALLRESDLDTDETETDEDFYDEHPQQLANKLLAEKRNQLMLLAAVAPASTDTPAAAPLNNGAIEAEERVKNHVPIPVLVTAPPVNTPQPKKKVKAKKRKKNEKAKQPQQQQQRTSTPTVESIKLNIPKSFYQTKPGFASSSPAFITVIPSRSSTPNLSTPAVEVSSGKESQIGNSSTLHAVGSGSETDNKRSSKRKRVPKRFYGDSSGEENEKQPVLKWRKVERPSFVTTPVTNPRPPAQTTFTSNSVIEPDEAPLVPQVSESESEAHVDSSSDSSESDTESQHQQQQQQQQLQQQLQSQEPQQHYHYQLQQQQPQPQPQPPSAPPHHPPQQHTFGTENNTPVLERSDNLYCYCQCPYDEVSEMIACDGDDCRIEWFHFECVGIMVPPKGKWYCPDCRKKHGILNINEDYFD